MARIRSVHPGMATDEDLVACSRDARLFFILLGTETDDYGCFEWKPVRLKMRLFPADDLHVDPLLEELAGVDKLMRYEVDGKVYGAIRNFCKFQKPKTPRAFCPRNDAVNDFIGLAKIISPERGKDAAPTPPPADDDGKPPAEGRKGGKEEGKKVTPFNSPKGDKPARGTRLPDNFPDAHCQALAEAYWREHQRPDLEFSDQVKRFRAHHLARGTTSKDWVQSWVTWYSNSPQFNRPVTGTARASPDNINSVFDMMPQPRAIG